MATSTVSRDCRGEREGKGRVRTVAWCSGGEAKGSGAELKMATAAGECGGEWPEVGDEPGRLGLAAWLGAGLLARERGRQIA